MFQKPAARRNSPENRRLWVCPVPARRHYGGHVVRLSYVHGAGGDHVSAVRRQGRPLVPGHNCVPVFNWKSAISGKKYFKTTKKKVIFALLHSI